MTIDIKLGKIKANLEHSEIMCKRTREVELDVSWVSCGVYQVEYYRPIDAKSHIVIVEEDWYPPNVSMTFTPEQFEKVIELYLDAPKHKRTECYKPFYESFDTDRGMFDFEYDTLFQAYKDPHEGVDKVYLVNHSFSNGIPTSNSYTLGLFMEDFQKLRDLIESKKDEIFYSGCRASFQS